tara:strand:+ start:83 stop:406 length:324 start_codon:yes stop_codon:yes gene_type:complete
MALKDQILAQAMQLRRLREAAAVLSPTPQLSAAPPAAASAATEAMQAPPLRPARQPLGVVQVQQSAAPAASAASASPLLSPSVDADGAICQAPKLRITLHIAQSSCW